MKSSEHHKMASVEDSLWWYMCLHKKVIDTLKNYNTKQDAQILDAGCGTGGMLKKLQAANYKDINGIDISKTAIEYTRNLGFAVDELNLSEVETKYSKNSLDVIISLDVLCYFTSMKAEKVLQSLSNILKKDGIVILNLPAYKSFEGMHDISVGLVGRTTRKEIEQQLKNTGFKITEHHHWPFILMPLIYSTRLSQRVKMWLFKDTEISSDIDLPPGWINKLFYTITCFEEKFGALRFFGSSIFVVAKKI